MGGRLSCARLVWWIVKLRLALELNPFFEYATGVGSEYLGSIPNGLRMFHLKT